MQSLFLWDYGQRQSKCGTMCSMVKTEELYYQNAYLKEFEGSVLYCSEGKNGSFLLVLDRTAFFPEQGGQSSDIGTISDAHVSHVSINDGVITHVVDREFAVGDKVSGVIDFGHRFSNMQQHTGEHIFSGIVSSRFGYDNVGFHLSDSEVTMDYNGVLTDEDIRSVEMAVNKAIWENVEVRCEFPSKEILDSLQYRSKKELTGDVRIVTVVGYDTCACCAPHVARTGEIGLLKVVSCQNYKGGVRVSILCGRRALEYINTQMSVVGELTGLLTTGSDKLVSSVKKLSDENYALKGELSECREKLIGFELDSIDKNKENVFLKKEPGLDGNLMRKTVNALTEAHSGFCGVFSGDDRSGYKYIIATRNGDKDLKSLQNMLRDEYGVKGGGTNAMVQGSMGPVNIADVIIKCESF